MFDVSYLRMIPGTVVMQPKDGAELRDMLWTAAKWEGKGAIAVRYPRSPIPDETFPDPNAPGAVAPRVLEIGRAEQLRAGGDVALIALGTMVAPALAAAETLAASGISATVVNARFARPLDEKVVTGLARSVGVTIEENVIAGGFGSAVSECLDANGLSATPHLRLGVPNEFVLHGKRDELLRQIGLDAEGIAARSLEWVRATQRQFT